jgi:hypothetical protein
MKNKPHPQSEKYVNGVHYIEERTNIKRLFQEIRQVFNPRTDIVVISPQDLEKASRMRDGGFLRDHLERVVTIESLGCPSIVRAGGSLNFAGGFFKQ